MWGIQAIIPSVTKSDSSAFPTLRAFLEFQLYRRCQTKLFYCLPSAIKRHYSKPTSKFKRIFQTVLNCCCYHQKTKGTQWVLAYICPTSSKLQVQLSEKRCNNLRQYCTGSGALVLEASVLLATMPLINHSLNTADDEYCCRCNVITAVLHTYIQHTYTVLHRRTVNA